MLEYIFERFTLHRRRVCVSRETNKCEFIAVLVRRETRMLRFDIISIYYIISVCILENILRRITLCAPTNKHLYSLEVHYV